MVSIEGRGLHGGQLCRLTLTRATGLEAREVLLVRNGQVRPLSTFSASGARRSTELVCDGETFRTVEHLFAALAGLGLHRGIAIELEGEEVPLVDGAARQFTEALATLGVPRSGPHLRVVKSGELEHGRSRMRFEVSGEVRASVSIDFGDSRLSSEASWNGTTEDFVARIATARTFGFAHEIDELARRGLASHVAKESVVVVTEDAILSAGAPFLADEPARHKLLDFMGDLFVWGGPPIGHVHASIPGHAATHALVAEALARGLLERT